MHIPYGQGEFTPASAVILRRLHDGEGGRSQRIP